MDLRLRIFFVFLGLVIITGTSPVAYADGISFRVMPLMTDVEADPGVAQTNVITVFNTAAAGSVPLHVKVTIKDWTLNAVGQVRLFAPGGDADGCASWLQINPLELNIPAGQSGTVRYTATPPPSSQGSYHCIVLFTTDPEPGMYKGESVNLSACIGNTIYVQVGTIVRRAKITGLALSSKNVTLTIQNTGSSYIRLAGTVKIADPAGNVLQEIKIPGDAVLPGTNNIRNISLDIPTELPAGNYTTTALLDYGGDALLGARINAVLP